MVGAHIPPGAHTPPGAHIPPGGHNIHFEEEEEVVGGGVEDNSCRVEHQVEEEGPGEAVRV